MKSCVQKLLWLPRMVLVCANIGAGASSESKQANLPCHLLLYPRYHLDHSSLLTRHPLSQVRKATMLLGNVLHHAVAMCHMQFAQARLVQSRGLTLVL